MLLGWRYLTFQKWSRRLTIIKESEAQFIMIDVWNRDLIMQNVISNRVPWLEIDNED